MFTQLVQGSAMGGLLYMNDPQSALTALIYRIIVHISLHSSEQTRVT